MYYELSVPAVGARARQLAHHNMNFDIAVCIGIGWLSRISVAPPHSFGCMLYDVMTLGNSLEPWLQALVI